MIENNEIEKFNLEISASDRYYSNAGSNTYQKSNYSYQINTTSSANTYTFTIPIPKTQIYTLTILHNQYDEALAYKGYLYTGSIGSSARYMLYLEKNDSIKIVNTVYSSSTYKSQTQLYINNSLVGYIYGAYKTQKNYNNSSYGVPKATLNTNNSNIINKIHSYQFIDGLPIAKYLIDDSQNSTILYNYNSDTSHYDIFPNTYPCVQINNASEETILECENLLGDIIERPLLEIFDGQTITGSTLQYRKSSNYYLVDSHGYDYGGFKIIMNEY